MKNFIKYFLMVFAGIIIGVLSTFILIFVIVLSFKEPVKAVNNNSYIVLDYPFELKEKPQTIMPGFFGLSGNNIQLLDMLRSIRHASTDDKIKGILINADLSHFQRTHIEELGKELEKFRDKGKKVYAWFSSGYNNNYLLGIYADEIYMPESSSALLTLQGYDITSPYMKKGLDKLGIDFNVIHTGNYKGTGENLVKNEISEESSEKYRSIYNSIFDKNMEEISRRRKIEKNVLISLISSGKTIMMTAKEAESSGFIDGFANFNELEERSKNKISIIDYAKTLQASPSANKIAVIYAEGTIYDTDGIDPFGNDIVSAESFISDIEKIKRDIDIKAVVIRINSPGGSSLASEMMLKEIIKLKKEKPVYISMGPTAASGGYYISSEGTEIFTSDTTITGSIGVVSILMNYESLAENLGIKFETVKKFKYDDIFSSYRKPTSDEIEIMRRTNRKVYDEFVAHVIKGRKIPENKIDGLAEGRLWTGSQAVKNRLADHIGGLYDAIEYASKQNHINDYQIVSYPVPESFISKIMNESPISNKNALIKELINGEKDTKIKQVLSLYNYSTENGKKPSMLMPDSIVP